MKSFTCRSNIRIFWSSSLKCKKISCNLYDTLKVSLSCLNLPYIHFFIQRFQSEQQDMFNERDRMNVCIRPVLCRSHVMDDIVIMDVHQHCHRLADDEWDPHGSIAIDSIQEATHKPSQRNLEGPESGGQSESEVSMFTCMLKLWLNSD